MSRQKQIITIATTAIIFLFIGIIVGGTTNQVSVGENTFQAGWDAAKQRLAETGFVPIMGMEGIEIKSVNGEIREINNSKITLKIQPLGPLADPELDVRIVEIANAKIYELIEKDQEEFQKEMEEFNKKMQTQGENLEIMIEPISELIVLPEMFIKQEIKLSDLKVGQQILVEAGKDVKEVKQFIAKEITLRFSPAISEMMMGEMLVPEGSSLLLDDN